MGASYAGSVAYAFDVLASYLRERANEGFVLVVLGDHQPAANVSGEGASWDVPVHVTAKRADLLASLQAQGFAIGVDPPREAIARMNALGPMLLATFNSAAPTSP